MLYKCIIARKNSRGLFPQTGSFHRMIAESYSIDQIKKIAKQYAGSEDYKIDVYPKTSFYSERPMEIIYGTSQKK